MADVLNTFAALSNDAPNVMIAKMMFELAERNLATGQFCKEYTLENYMSKTLRIVRYNRFNLPIQTLIEGVPPDSVGLGFTYVDVTVEQWGIVALLTDIGVLTLSHPVLQIAIERCALALAELIERENTKVLMSGTSVTYGNTASQTTRAAIIDTGTPKTDRLTTATVLNGTVRLRALGAPPWEGNLYGGVIQPQQEGDLNSSDTTFQNASNFARVRKLENAEVGIWMGVQWVRGNFLPIFRGVAAPDTNAITAVKAKGVVADTGGSLTTGNFKIAVVARDVVSDYERKISQTSANYAVSASIITGSIAVTTPSSVNYVYDIYSTTVGGTVLFKVFSRVPASTTVQYTTAPTGTEVTAPVAPADGVEIFCAWLLGKDGLARVKLNQMSLQTYITANTATWSNPLNQGRKVGAKMMYKAAIQDQNFIHRMETVSAYSALLPA